MLTSHWQLLELSRAVEDERSEKWSDPEIREALLHDIGELSERVDELTAQLAVANSVPTETRR